MAIERTLSIIKPDAVAKNVIGQIYARFEGAGLKIVAAKMAHLKDEMYKPIAAHKRVYDQLYAEYVVLHDYFGRGANDVMKRLKRIKAELRGTGLSGGYTRNISNQCVWKTIFD